MTEKKTEQDVPSGTPSKGALGEFPPWLRRPWGSGALFESTRNVVQGYRVHTVCQSARCPNQGDCWQRRTATFMILGNVCTRNCLFCSVRSGNPARNVDLDEPLRVAEAVRALSIRHAVITSVTRDDLLDGGAQQFSNTIRAIREINPHTTVEVLTPDFKGDVNAVRTVAEAYPEVFGHNIETVERLHAVLRRNGRLYEKSLSLLRFVSSFSEKIIVKSALMLGHGETRDEIIKTLKDLRDVGCQVVAMGQYLRPTKSQRAVQRYITPDEFQELEQIAYSMGFLFVTAGPFVRSSYRAEEPINMLKEKCFGSVAR